MPNAAIYLLLTAVIAVACTTVQEAVGSIGAYRSPSGDCTARVSLASMGGFRQLFLLRTSPAAIHIADDVTGIAWLSNTELVYAVSPVYGSPGVFLLDCGNPTTSSVRLVAAVTFNAAYPMGADFFELKSVSGRRVTYYYGQDVDTVDFKLLRSAANQRSIDAR